MTSPCRLTSRLCRRGMRSPVLTAASKLDWPSASAGTSHAVTLMLAAIRIGVIIANPLDTGTEKVMIHLEAVMGLNDNVRAVLDHKGVGVCAVTPQTPVYEALEIMADKDIGAVLVMEDADL